MEIRRSGSQSSAKGPAEYFTGNVRVDPLFQAAVLRGKQDENSASIRMRKGRRMRDEGRA
jgi:hypothetical protein